jgi:hypothetical protein
MLDVFRRLLALHAAPEGIEPTTPADIREGLALEESRDEE